MITEKLSLALSIKLFNEGVEFIKLKLKGHQHHKAYAEAIEAYLVGYSDKYSKLKPLLHGGNQFLSIRPLFSTPHVFIKMSKFK